MLINTAFTIMAVNSAHLLTLLLSFGFYKSAGACELVPSSVGSCFELSASPYITFESSQFGPTIEGASVNVKGDMFSVDYGNKDTTNQLGQFFPQQRLFYRDAKQSYFNGIRFLNSTTAFVADAQNHRVLKIIIDPEGNVVSNGTSYCSDVSMIQPNDLTLSTTGTVFTSGMNWLPDTDNTDGDIWSCLPDGTHKRLERMGRTNGIDLTPDEQHLYVSESYNKGGVPIAQKIWKYNANVEEGAIANKTLFADFDVIDKTAAFDIDGMKTDINGNLFVARYGGGHVAVLSERGQLLGKIKLNFPNPTNLEFGGLTGTVLFIVGQCKEAGKGCVDKIHLATPGRSWSMLQNTRPKKFDCKSEL